MVGKVAEIIFVIVAAVGASLAVYGITYAVTELWVWIMRQKK